MDRLLKEAEQRKGGAQAAHDPGSLPLSAAEDLSPDSSSGVPASKRARTEHACSPNSLKQPTACAMQSASMCAQPAEQPAA